MYDLRPYTELNFEVTPASIMYKLESIHRRLNETYGNIAACSSKNASNSAPASAPTAAMVNGGHTSTFSHCNGSATDDEIADIQARQQNVIKRIEQLRSKLDNMIISQKANNDTKQTSGNEKGKGKGDKKEKKEKTTEKSAPVKSQKCEGGDNATCVGVGVPQVPLQAESIAPNIGQSIAACAPPTLLDFGNSSVSVDEILSGDQKIDISLSIGANDVNWASALLNILTSRRKNVSVRSFKHSTNSGAVPSLTTLPFDEHAPVGITVVIKSGDDVGPSISLGSRKHGPIVGFLAVWKLLGRMGGLYPSEMGVFADAASRIDFWLEKAMAVARSDPKLKDVTIRDISSFLGRCDFLGVPYGLSLADVVLYGLLCSNKNSHPSNLESWLARCRSVGVKACCC